MNPDYYYEVTIRITRIVYSVKMTQLRWVILSNFLVDPAPLSETALSEICGIPRTTIRPHIKELIELEVVCRNRDGRLEIVPRRRAEIRRFSVEMLEIAHGRRKGFSQETLLALIRAHDKRPWKPNKPLDLELLANLQFQPPISPLTKNVTPVVE